MASRQNLKKLQLGKKKKKNVFCKQSPTYYISINYGDLTCEYLPILPILPLNQNIYAYINMSKNKIYSYIFCLMYTCIHHICVCTYLCSIFYYYVVWFLVTYNIKFCYLTCHIVLTINKLIPIKYL